MSPVERLPYHQPPGPFGHFTRDASILAAARAWLAEAVADGWSIAPTYGSEPVERASRLTRDGFVVQSLTRENEAPKNHEISISIWGPDGLGVKTPPLYDFAAIQAGTRACKLCGAKEVETQRYSFAGRCCAACLPGARAKYERPGWCD